MAGVKPTFTGAHCEPQKDRDNFDLRICVLGTELPSNSCSICSQRCDNLTLYIFPSMLPKMLFFQSREALLLYCVVPFYDVVTSAAVKVI